MLICIYKRFNVNMVFICSSKSSKTLTKTITSIAHPNESQLETKGRREWRLTNHQGNEHNVQYWPFLLLICQLVKQFNPELLVLCFLKTYKLLQHQSTYRSFHMMKASAAGAHMDNILATLKTETEKCLSWIRSERWNAKAYLGRMEQTLNSWY